MNSMVQIDVGSAFPEACRYANGRFTFDCEALDEGGILRLAAWQVGRVWLNGVLLGQLYVRSHEDEWRYLEFDLTGRLRQGRNTIGVLLHAWGAPDDAIPGVPSPRPLCLAAAGGAGNADFADHTRWRFTPAPDFLPAPRHNSLIGHEELRDLRLECLDWLQPDFDDSAWVAGQASIGPTLHFLPAPHRQLGEEVHVPSRIVEQGRHLPAWTVRSLPPSATHKWWRICPGPLPAPLLFFHSHRVGSRLFVDGREWQLPLFPPMEWAELYHGVPLESSDIAHELHGSTPVPPELPYPAPVPPMLFGWDQLPEHGDHIEWASSCEGPWTEGHTAPDVEHRLMIDRIEPLRLCALRPDGQLDLRVKDDVAAVVLEFPRSITMLPSLEFADATEGVEVELVYSERLSTMPGIRFPAVYRDRAILRSGPQTWNVALQYKSARYLMIIVRAPGGFAHLRRVSAVYRHYDYQETGRFASSDTRLNAIWDICRNTMEAGSQDVIVDGPWREQLLYIGDNYVHNQAAYHLYDNLEIIRWQHHLYAQGQMPDGIFQPNQPCRTPPEQYRLLDQTMLWPIQLEHHWQHTADREFIRELLPNVVCLLDGFHTRFGGEADPRLRDLTGWNWVDHPGLLDGRELRSIRHEGVPTAINMLYAMALDAAARLLRECGGRPEDHTEAHRFTARRAGLCDCLRARHWDARRMLFADCVVEHLPSPEASLHVNLLAILGGVAQAPGALLDSTWNRPGVLQPCGVFFHIHLLEVLHRLGRHTDVLQEIRRQWGAFLDAGLTTTPEYTTLNDDWWASVGHPWGASPIVYLLRSIAGLTPLAPGWALVGVDPHLGDLRKVRVTVPTPRGPLEADLHQTHGNVAGVIRVPYGVEVRIPEPALRGRIEVVVSQEQQKESL